MKMYLDIKLLLILIWSISVLLSLVLSGYAQYTYSIKIAHGIASATFDKDQAFRQWASSHGGVYVPVDMNRTPPSKYLAHIKDRDIITPSGKKLTLMNPAYMLRQLIDDYSGLYGTKGHITALEILNPNSIADKWETKALKTFQKDNSLKEISELVETQGKQTLRLMRPMKITKGCLKCHGHQASYLNTESAGGVSITVPLAEIYSDAIASFKNTLIMHIIFLIAGLIFINFINKKEEKSRKKLHYYANNDSLTGLLNRHAYTEKIEKLIKSHNVETIYVLFMDLDNFKMINDTLGHTIGDLLLQNVAKSIQNEITDVEMFVRFGGDEFILVFTNIERIQTLESKIQKIHAIFNKAFILDNYEVHTSASIGISAYPENSDDIESLLKNADIAMYYAKHSGRNKHIFYKPEMMAKSKNKLILENDLHKALQNDELYLLYQPQISLKTEKIVGVEALIRWNNPNQGTISPLAFIPIAEANGLIMPIGEWIIDTACNQLAIWRNTPMKELTISINISAKQLMHQDLYKYIKNALIRTGADAKLLEIEITESVIMENINETANTLEKLKTLGLSIAIDDFGTGYSSLSYLKKLPIDRLKIDREFIKDIPDNKDDIAIAKAIVSLAKALELVIVAEGPETQTQINFLKESQCDIAQGYFYAKPLSSSEVEVFLN